MPDRILRESICTSETLNLLSDFEERFWNRLIVNCDDFGRFDARPEILKGRLFPLMNGKTKKDMTDALQKLASVGLVELYHVGGKPFLHVVTWERYQRIRAKKSKFPSPDESCCQMTPNVPVFESEMRNAYSKCEVESESVTRVCDPVVAAVQADYLNRINPSASPNSLDELAGFVESVGPEFCKRAFDIALDCKKTTWPYIRAILRDKQKNGVKCLADWDSIESKRSKESITKSEKMGAWDYVDH